jgi:hypothetical protein
MWYNDETSRHMLNPVHITPHQPSLYSIAFEVLASAESKMCYSSNKEDENSCSETSATFSSQNMLVFFVLCCQLYWVPQGCEMSRLPHFIENWLTDGGEVVSLTHWPPCTPQEGSWYSFLLEAESTPGPGHSATGSTSIR